ncbi:hypothetical protein NBRC116495_33860 [Aurantivibrio plasticivorans]
MYIDPIKPRDQLKHHCEQLDYPSRLLLEGRTPNLSAFGTNSKDAPRGPQIPTKIKVLMGQVVDLDQLGRVFYRVRK